jgi:hypothetical protein
MDRSDAGESMQVPKLDGSDPTANYEIFLTLIGLIENDNGCDMSSTIYGHGAIGIT